MNYMAILVVSRTTLGACGGTNQLIKRLVGFTFAIGLASPAAFAQEASQPAKLSLTPHLGVVSESDFVSGVVRFSDGDTDFISIEPGTGLQLGAELNYRFRPKVTGVLGLSYTIASARYIEKDNVRRDVGVSTIRLQPGVMVSVVNAGKAEISVGGGLTIARVAIDDMRWDGFPVDPSSTAIGLFGAAGIEVPLSGRASFHGHLVLELNKPSYGDLESGLARADGEAASEVDHDLRSAIILAAGVTFGL